MTFELFEGTDWARGLPAPLVLAQGPSFSAVGLFQKKRANEWADIHCLHGPSSVCPLLSSPFTGLRATLIHCDLILSNYVYKDSISKESHILRFWWTCIWRGHYSTHYNSSPSPHLNQLYLLNTLDPLTPLHPAFLGHSTWSRCPGLQPCLLFTPHTVVRLRVPEQVKSHSL